MNPSSYFRMPPPLSEEPPIKISTADIGKIIGEKEAQWAEGQEGEGENPQPYPPEQGEEVIDFDSFPPG